MKQQIDDKLRMSINALELIYSLSPNYEIDADEVFYISEKNHVFILLMDSNYRFIVFLPVCQCIFYGNLLFLKECRIRC